VQRQHENFNAIGIGDARKSGLTEKERFIHNPKQASEGLVQNYYGEWLGAQWKDVVIT
jgi:hypothetical protein